MNRTAHIWPTGGATRGQDVNTPRISSPVFRRRERLSFPASGGSVVRLKDTPPPLLFHTDLRPRLLRALVSSSSRSLTDDDLPADSIHCGSSWRQGEIPGHVTGMQRGPGDACALHHDAVGCWLCSFGCCPHKPERKNNFFKMNLYFTGKEKRCVIYINIILIDFNHLLVILCTLCLRIPTSCQ